MDIIENYKPIKKNYHLVYLAKPIYGGWVTFTAHCSKKYGYPIYKITKKTEKSNNLHRPVGLGIQGLADVFFMLNISFYVKYI